MLNVAHPQIVANLVHDGIDIVYAMVEFGTDLGQYRGEADVCLWELKLQALKMVSELPGDLAGNLVRNIVGNIVRDIVRPEVHDKVLDVSCARELYDGMGDFLGTGTWEANEFVCPREGRYVEVLDD